MIARVQPMKCLRDDETVLVTEAARLLALT